MSNSVKRCRQMTLMESFGRCNRTKSSDSEQAEMSTKQEMRELLASAVEKRLTTNSETLLSESCGSTCETVDMGSEPQSLSSNSEELFPNSATFDDSSDDENTVLSLEHTVLKRWPECASRLPDLKPCADHTIMFRPHLREGSAPRPYPDEYYDKWDTFHVRMPCSPHNLYPAEDQDGELKLRNRWEVICESLTMQMNTVADLENAIMRYNRQYIGKWNFSGLQSFFSEHVEPEDRARFFNSLLPNMANLALQLPSLCTQPIPLLKVHVDHKITLSQKQISCLLANAFFCTFPRRNHPRRYMRCPTFPSARVNNEYGHYPDINFNRLFFGTKAGISERNREKLKCLFNYFSRVTANEPTGTVTFHRQYLRTFPNWGSSTKSIRDVIVCSDGLIETEGHGMLQVDFANMFVGGGVLGQGCVQEEIRFVICPELIVSMLFTECLSDSEALIVTGVEQYNKYTGYGDTFTWDGDHQDDTLRDAWGRRITQMVAIDAIHFRKSEEQFRVSRMQRELNKAYVGFFDNSVPSENRPAVATGNWGCGAYRGYPNLKFLIQLMATAQSERGLLYFTFGSKKLERELRKMYSFIVEKKLTVGNLWWLLEKYSMKMTSASKACRPLLYDYIYNTHSGHSVQKQANDDIEWPENGNDLFEDTCMWPGLSD